MQKRKQFQILRITFDIRNPRRLQDKTNTKLHCQGKSTYYHWKITNPPSQLAYGYYHHPPNNIPQWCVHNFVPMCFYLHKRNFLCRSSTRNMFSKELTGFFTLILSVYTLPILLHNKMCSIWIIFLSHSPLFTESTRSAVNTILSKLWTLISSLKLHYQTIDAIKFKTYLMINNKKYYSTNAYLYNCARKLLHIGHWFV